MGKLAYFFVTFVGVIPAGFGIYVMVMHFLARSEAISGLLLTISIVITLCLFLILLTPLIVLIFYKDTRPQLATAGAAIVGAAGQAATARDGEFGDAIPEDFDQEELAASAPGKEEEEEEYDDDYADDDYEESEFDDFDLDEKE